MSEEMKQKIDALAMRLSGATGEKWFVPGIAAAIEHLLAQVWEQREKEHGNQFCERHIDTTLAVANVSEPCPLCQLEQRTEAAELALREANPQRNKWAMLCDHMQLAYKKTCVADVLKVIAQARQQAIAECVEIAEQAGAHGASCVGCARLIARRVHLRALHPTPSPKQGEIAMAFEDHEEETMRRDFERAIYKRCDEEDARLEHEKIEKEGK